MTCVDYNYTLPMDDAFRNDVRVLALAVSHDTARAALRWARSRPEEAWAQVSPRSKDRTRLKFGQSGFYGTNEGWSPHIPPDLLTLGNEALAVAQNVVQDAPWDAFSAIDTVVVNRYTAGKGVAKHKAPPRWVPLVIGVTLCDDPCGPVSAMLFENGQHRVPVPTPHRSAYVFHSRAYTDATHARKPGVAKQKGTVYSFTFRARA